MQQATNSVRHRTAMQEHSIWSQVTFGIYWVQGYCSLTFINLLSCLTWVFKFYLNYRVVVKERSGPQHSLNHKGPGISELLLPLFQNSSLGTQLSFHIMCWDKISLHTHCLANQTHFNMKCRAPGRKSNSEMASGKFFVFLITDCNSGNSTPWFTECSVDCCEGNLCNKIPEPTTKPQDQPTSKAFELVASFGAILFVFALNMFA